MAAVQLNPYINFNDNTEEALNFYQSVLGGKVTLSRFSEYASPEMPVAKEHENLVMHGVLTTEYLELFAADALPMGGTTPGTNITLSLSGEDETILTNYFEGLAKGGAIEQPLAKAPWGDSFGMLTDKYGIHWMVNISDPNAQV